MRSPLVLLAAVPLVAFAGCGNAGSSAPAATADSAKVPDGVVEQYATLQEEIADAGGEATSGPWKVGYIVESAEPWFEVAGHDQRLREPADGETHHIEVIPREAETGRIVPDVPVRLEVVDSKGEVVDSGRLGFLYSTFFHYADNFTVPEKGTYTLRVSLEPPTFRRHGEPGSQPPLTEPATVSFRDVELTGG